jgi:hypothetical protein
MVSLLAFLPVASRVPDYARLIGALVLDERMPADRKVMLGAAAGYLVLTIRRVPGLVAAAGRAIERSGIVPRTRAWISKEEPTT